MKKYLMLLLFLPCLSFGQKKNKIDKMAFCGWQMKDREKIRAYTQSQFDFLKVQDGDTIVDIGASSGAFEGTFLSVNEAKNVSFVLVDINASCLNQQKLKNMLAFYSSVRGDSIKNNFRLVQNTPDSLWLPLNQYKKVWILNTLHEVPEQAKMVKDICAILQPGGEVVILENPARHEGQLHGGCHKPLLTFDKINELFMANGFSYVERDDIVRKRSSAILMVRFIKN